MPSLLDSMQRLFRRAPVAPVDDDVPLTHRDFCGTPLLVRYVDLRMAERIPDFATTESFDPRAWDLKSRMTPAELNEAGRFDSWLEVQRMGREGSR